MGHIVSSRVWYHPRIVWTILSHVPTLDPLVVLFNNVVVLYIGGNGEVMSFVAIKNYRKSYELGTVYTYPKYRNQGYASMLITYVTQKYHPIGLLCKTQMIAYYERCGFRENDNDISMLKIRRVLFNRILGPLLGYGIVSMIYMDKRIL